MRTTILVLLAALPFLLTGCPATVVVQQPPSGGGVGQAGQQGPMNYDLCGEEKVVQADKAHPCFNDPSACDADGLLAFVGVSKKHATEQGARTDALKDVQKNIVASRSTFVATQSQETQTNVGKASDMLDPDIVAKDITTWASEGFVKARAKYWVHEKVQVTCDGKATYYHTAKVLVMVPDPKTQTASVTIDDQSGHDGLKEEIMPQLVRVLMRNGYTPVDKAGKDHGTLTVTIKEEVKANETVLGVFHIAKAHISWKLVGKNGKIVDADTATIKGKSPTNADLAKEKLIKNIDKQFSGLFQ